MTTNTKITPELLDQLLANYEKPEDLTGEDGLFKQLKKALIERALGAELSEHLGYEKGDPAGRGSGNSRNGTSSKTILTQDGEIEIAVPRDRAGSFEPLLIGKGQTRFDGFDDKILSLYARGMTVREIQGHLAELYGTEVSPDLISRVTDDLISRVTDAVVDEVREWQNRPLDAVYPVVFFDAMRVKIRDEGLVKNKAVYVALALNPDGEKEVLGLWIEQTEGAKFWLKVVNELKARGVNDILIAVVDGLKGFPEAITSVFPQSVVQTCIVHLIRNSLAFVSWKDRKAILPAIKAIYRAENADMAMVRLEEFEAEWGKRYPAIGQAWRRAWEHVVPFFAFAPGIRKMIYTTNAVEALHRSLRKIIKTRGSFPNDDAALKLLYLAIRNAGMRWRRSTEWTAAMGQFAIQFGPRFPGSAR
jgi:putative transposase